MARNAWTCATGYTLFLGKLTQAKLFNNLARQWKKKYTNEKVHGLKPIFGTAKQHKIFYKKNHIAPGNNRISNKSISSAVTPASSTIN